MAYYFHGNVRCATCRTIEAYAHEAVTGGFPSEMDDGRIQWRVVNVEDSGNRHFVDDFQLTTRSVVLVDLLDGRQAKWKNLADVWNHVRDKDAFLTYVRQEVRDYLGGD